MPLLHLTWAAERRQTLFPDVDLLRRGVRALDRTLGDKALFFSIADDHLHAVVDAEPRVAGYLGKALRQAMLSVAPDRPLLSAHVRPVEGRAHLRHLVRSYLPGQVTHHGLRASPALHEGSAFLDLVGARVLDRFSSAALRRWLPRFRLRELFPAVGLEPRRLEPVEPATIARLGPARLAEAARAAFATSARGRTPPAVAARQAAAVLAAKTGLPLRQLAEEFGVSTRSAQRDANRTVDDRHLRAVRTRLALELREPAPVVAEPPAPWGEE